MTVLKMATEKWITLEDTNLLADWVSLPVLTGDDCLLVVVQVGGKSNQFTSHVGHVHKLEISVEASIRKNFATLDGFATRCHVTSP